MKGKRQDRKTKDRQALAKAIAEFQLKLRMREVLEERLTKKIFRLVLRGLGYTREDIVWCRFMVYALTTLMADGLGNLENYPGDRDQLAEFLFRIAEKVELFALEEFGDLFPND